MHTPKSITELYERATCVFSKNDIEAALDRMAKEMNICLGEKNPIFFMRNDWWHNSAR